MKILERAAKALDSVMNVERRTGVYVARRVTNGEEWHAWAVRHGVPNPLAANDMHVTVVHSQVDVKMIPDKTVKSIYIGPGYGGAACFALLGPKAESLCVCFSDWDLYNRHWNWVENGAVCTWPTYRPHMTITNEVGEFELSDEALADAPLYVNMGPEYFEDLRQPEVADSDPEGVEDEDEDAELIIIIDVQMAAAKALLESDAALTVLDRVALLDVANGRQITRGVAKRIGAQSWASDDLKRVIAEPKEKPVLRTRDVVVEVRAIPEEIARSGIGFKPDKVERMIVGIANVTTVGGELVVDSYDTSFTTHSVTEWMRDAIRQQRGTDFDHEGPESMEIVQGFVLSDDVQRALGIDLGFEPCLVEVHVPEDKDWAEVEDGEWMFSIRGTFAYEEVDV